MWPTVAVPGLGEWPTNGLIRATYFLAALALVLHLNSRQGIAFRITLRAFAFGVPVAAIGARLLDMIEYTGRYHSLADVLGRNGSSAYGALFAIFAFLWLFTRWQGVPYLRLLDAGAPAMALGEAMTRIGCFLNGCCYGTPWTGPWAVIFPPTSFAFRDQVASALVPATAPHSLAVHPVQLYSLLAMLCVALGLIWWFYRRPPAGGVFFGYLVAYGGLRLAVGMVRVEALSSMKVFSVVFILVGLIGLCRTGRQKTDPGAAASPSSASVLPLR
jgi:phosphatidylglycerol:prolipoprotein diacylglycerol transferase